MRRLALAVTTLAARALQPHRSTRARALRCFSVSGPVYDGDGPTIELFTKAGCTLCDEATAVLASVRAVAPHTLVAVDITAEGNGEWWDRYKYDIPVLHVDGKYWAKHRVAAGDAIDALEDLVDGEYDFCFIDADKPSYDAYYERALDLLKPGGLLAVDNVLWNGAVIDDQATDAETLALRALNKKIRDDPRVDLSMLPVGDGLTLVRKREDPCPTAGLSLS